MILILAGAFLWRLRGGLLNNLTGEENWLGIFNDTTVRAIFAIGMTWAFWGTHPYHMWVFEHFAVAHGVPVWIGGGLTGLALFAGTTVVGWYGADLYPTHWKDVFWLSVSGFVRMTFVAVALVSFWPLVAGILCGPTYWLASKLPHPKGWMFWGEIMFGAVIGASLCLVS